jgi:TolB protein
MFVQVSRPVRRFASAKAALVGFVALAVAFPAVAQTPAPPPAAPPPASSSEPVTTVVVQGGSRALFRVAVVSPMGDATMGSQIVETTTRDLTLSSLFQVLEPKSFTANLTQEGVGIDPSSWRNIGAEGVVKGSLTARGEGSRLELRLYVVSRGGEPVLKKEYDVSGGSLRSAVHQFDNEVVRYFTGTPGSFGGRLVFSATTGRGQKGVFSIESDGQGLARLPTASNVALAPAIGPGGVHYAGGLPDGSYRLFRVGQAAPVLEPQGLVFGVAFGSSKMALVLSQQGQSDIWVGGADGSGLKKVTSGGLNTHPAFGPGGQLAYVSSQSGNPQIFVDGKRVSFRGTYNMAPVFCNDPEGPRIVFMGRDGANWDIFSVDLGGSNMRRLTQDQGSNTYPACSPDGRMVAFFSSRGGLFVSNPQGQNQQKIANVTGESLRWEGN